MSSTAERVKEMVQSELQADFVECIDFSDANCDGAKLELTVVSAQFEGKPPLARHRLVNAALAEIMGEIHALTIKAWTPAQYESKKAET